jgi:hypothetical protein
VTVLPDLEIHHLSYLRPSSFGYFVGVRTLAALGNRTRDPVALASII